MGWLGGFGGFGFVLVRFGVVCGWFVVLGRFGAARTKPPHSSDTILKYIHQTFFQAAKTAMGNDLKLAILRTIEQKKTQSNKESFRGSGEYLDEDDLRAKYKDKPTQIANILANTRQYFCKIRGVTLFEIPEYTRDVEEYSAESVTSSRGV